MTYHCTLENGIHCTIYDAGVNFMGRRLTGIYLELTPNKSARAIHKSKKKAFEKAMAKILQIIAKDIEGGKESIFDDGFERKYFDDPKETCICEKCKTVMPKEGAYR
jgi:hypothetical protein